MELRVTGSSIETWKTRWTTCMAKEEVAHKEKQRVEEAVWDKWKHKEEAAARKKKAAEAKAVWERCKQQDAKAQVTHYEAWAKTLVPEGEPIRALDSDSESGVSLLAVTDLVSLCACFFLFLFFI